MKRWMVRTLLSFGMALVTITLPAAKDPSPPENVPSVGPNSPEEPIRNEF